MLTIIGHTVSFLLRGQRGEGGPARRPAPRFRLPASTPLPRYRTDVLTCGLVNKTGLQQTQCGMNLSRDYQHTVDSIRKKPRKL